MKPTAPLCKLSFTHTLSVAGMFIIFVFFLNGVGKNANKYYNFELNVIGKFVPTIN